MKRLAGNILILSVVSLMTGALLFAAEMTIRPYSPDYSTLWLIPLFFVVSLIPLFIVRLIPEKADEHGMNKTLAALGVKILMAGTVALIWFGGLKKEGTTDILLFFIVYLAFSIVTVILILKSLKPGE